MLRQKKISYWLKGLDIVLAVMGLAFFIVMSLAYLYIKELLPGMLWSSIYFLWFTAVFYYVILFQFWKVTTQIGENNSFSEENRRAFHNMALAGCAGAIGFLSKLLWLLYQQTLAPAVAVLIISEILISGVFIVLAEALSKLIQNAYEMKRENELTI